MSVKYVLIPAADDSAITELELAIPPTLEENIGALTKALNDYYRRQTGELSDAQRDALVSSVRQQVAEKNKDSAPPDERMLSQVALSQTCDILQLLPPTPKSSWVGVSMYVDDKGAERVASCLRLGKLSREPPRKRALVGVAKQLPPNRRASEVCRQCGLSVEVLGDAFVARAWDDQEGYERQHFDAAQQPRRAAQLASDSEWMSAAREANAGRGTPGEAQQRLAEAPFPRSFREPAESRAWRGKGTASFKGGDVAAAAAAYAEALSLLQPAPAVLDAAAADRVDALRLPCLLNLAACRLREARPFEAISACDAAVGIDAGSAKAWYRRGQARAALGQRRDAPRRGVEPEACKLAPSSREIRDEYEKVKEAAAKQASARPMAL
ncbi:hypothetical protein EMIHUDRAFT_111484 [Emiliania huxleyi CCMP1516]|uniref:Uncharacterized protein n=2 Tax=Emiliania huxleyi TaxID=2903 RepID=A0A0D3KDW3_EMIH1|nr:hypothetical protein EMIHUDRAFT_111484 [Emiliania huxleyi CCMP1516]EOD33948.1 hypothetical protein EMIHUDRAFT_111484 [Emiliania huxleyi CCMP1516]|eukprot:XP_005786377.1 hypothetical protein EMIHUDRAFT_111484 [Emiliania huxleyi CCMP1516]